MDYKEKIQKLINGEMIDGIRASEIQIGVLKALFPEFTESEDERIRKEIINFLELPHPQFVGKRDHEKWIAWLEKQGEQKSNDKVEPKFKVGDTIRLKGTLAEYTIESISGECYHGKGWGLLTSYDDDYEIVEQKPINSQFTPEQSSVLDKHIDKFLEQKPAWSEEDEHCIELLLPIIDSSSLIQKNRKKCKNFLNSLKDRVQPQPRQGWNEKDERRIEECAREAEDRLSEDIPYWKKSTLPNDSVTGFNSDFFSYNGYCINYKELFDKLPKED